MTDETFEQIYGANIARVRSFLRIYLGNSTVVDDVAQETFFQFWCRPNGFDPARSTLRTYLLGIARKRAADWWRHHRPTAEPQAELASTANPSMYLLCDAMDRLDQDLRNILWLREVEGYSYDELAHILDLPLGTVKSRLFTARERLRQLWETR
jgi:RNA polymerase sigma-70 factor (ECF subfamily)